MKIHYFQRYHSRENVATANTMLLLSRLYSYSSDKFFSFLKSEYFADEFEPGIVFNLQDKSEESIPDAVITQEGFKLVVETKMTDWFDLGQLKRHCKAFKDERNKVLITISSEVMSAEKKKEFGKWLDDYNEKKEYPIMHINTTFEKVAEGISNVLDDRDVEMQNVLEDYLSYCYNDKLIVGADSWRWMRAHPANTTFDFNTSHNLYYNGMDKGFRPHDYLGLYKEKSIRAVGKITAIVTAKREKGKLEYFVEKGILTNEMKEKIEIAIEDAKKYGYKLESERYFFVDKFYDTDYKKVTPNAMWGARNFDLSLILGTNSIPPIKEIAERLRSITWG